MQICLWAKKIDTIVWESFYCDSKGSWLFSQEVTAKINNLPNNNAAAQIICKYGHFSTKNLCMFIFWPMEMYLPTEILVIIFFYSVNIKASNCNCCFVVVKIAHWGYIRSRSFFCFAIRVIIGQILLFHFASI